MRNKRRRLSSMESNGLKTETSVKFTLKPNVFAKLNPAVSNDIPEPRSGHRIVCNERWMLSIGGYNIMDNRGFVLKEVWLFDLATFLWRKFNTVNLPSELASCAAALSGNILFLYGGTGSEFGRQVNRDVYVCDLRSINQQLKFCKIETTKRRPPKHYGQSIVVKDHFLYTVGGTNGINYSIDVWRFDMEERTWAPLFVQREDNSKSSYVPAERYRHETVLYNNHLYVIGGGTNFVAFELEDIPAFDLSVNRWKKFVTTPDPKSNFPIKRKCHGCVQHPHDRSIVFITGGLTDGLTDGSLSLSDTWKLDLKSLTWTCIETLSLPEPLGFHGATITPDGKLLVFGGVQLPSKKRSTNLYAAWIIVPKLKDVCWDAVSYYSRVGQLKLSTEHEMFVHSMKPAF